MSRSNRDCYAKKYPATGVAGFPVSGRKGLADALPGLAAAEQATEGAALDFQDVRTLHRDRGVVIAAGVRIVDAAGPFAVGGLHVDQDLLIGVFGVAAQIGAALLDAHVALVVGGLP